MKKPLFYEVIILIALLIVVSSTQIHAATQTDIPGPVGSGTFGTHVAILPNGNFVVTDPAFSITTPQMIANVGAAYLYNSSGTLISTITGNCAGDNVGGGGIKVLANGNYVIKSPNFDYAVAGGATSNNCLSTNSADGATTATMPVRANTGAVTLGFAASGVSGTVSPANSFIGSFANDQINEVVALPSGNYLVQAGFWNGNRGAVAWRSGAVASTGFMTASNSQSGENPGDYIGRITVLPNGNYLVHSPTWNLSRGVVSLCTAPTGCTGVFTAENSIIGSPGDNIGDDGIVILTNNNFVIRSRSWNGQRGAVTWGNGTTATVGVVSSSNSLVGNAANDFVGSAGITPLANGNYVVNSPLWKNGATTAGAATFGNGATGTSGLISSANSLIGNSSSDFFLSQIVALTNGNYVISLPRADIPTTPSSGAAIWGNGTTGINGTISTSNSLYRGGDGGVVPLANGNYVVISYSSGTGTGAVTWGNGATGITGEISAANSLIGASQNDIFSGGVTPLKNGNYVVYSYSWDNGNAVDAGAVTFCNGATGFIGVISAANSLVGTKAQDRVGYGGVTALPNGNYVVGSHQWDNGSIQNAGAFTFGNGTTGIVGQVSAGNSLIGDAAEDNVGIGPVTSLPNGNYLATSFSWRNGRGAVTLGNGVNGITGVVSAANSFVGTAPGDMLGLAGANGVKAYSDNAYTIHSASLDNETLNGAGAVSLGKPNIPLTGEVNVDNSVRGTVATAGSNLVYDYNPQKKFMVVGRWNNRIVTIFRYELPKTVFDFDGDGKTDIGIFRPSDSSWWYSRSSDNAFRVFSFGTSSDVITPGDFTGDGKADLSVFRPSTGEWYIQRSEDNSFFSFPFGAAGDVPIPSDYDGDGKTDAAVFRPSSGTWFILNSNGSGTSIVTFGSSEDKPVPADFDGDGKADIAIFRPSDGSWWYLRSSDSEFRVFRFGLGTDKPVQGDYTGDGKADLAVFRPETGEWFFQRSEDNSYYSVPFGAVGDLPTPGDYDGDGKFDTAVFRPASASWFVQRSTAGILIAGFGASGDRPIPNAFVP